MDFRIDSGKIAASYDTPDGYRRVYLRLARADHDYPYLNQDGTERIERCSAAELFRTDSADTAKMIPIGLGHPASVRIDSRNAAGWMIGSTGHSVIRENTADGDFLGITATIFDENAKRRMDQDPGISPGYATDLARGDGFFNQKNRRYNHVAAAVIPRGGEAVKAVFDGLRFDSADDDSVLWIARPTEDTYAVAVNQDFIQPILERDDAVGGLAQRSAIDLDRFKGSNPGGEDKPNGKKPKAKKEKCDDCDHDEKSGEYKQKDSSRGIGFGVNNKRKKRMDSVSLRIGDITYDDVPISLATAVQPLVSANDRVDELEAELNQLRADAAARIEEINELKSDLALLEAEDRNDSVEPDMDLVLEYATNIATTVDRMRADGQMLVEAGLITEFNTDFNDIVENMADLQGEMIAIASPGMKDRVDSLEGEALAVAYDASISSMRHVVSQMQQRQDSEEDRADMKHAMPAKRNILTRIGQTAKPMNHRRKAVELLSQYEKKDDEVFDQATKNAAHQMRHPMAMKVM